MAAVRAQPERKMGGVGVRIFWVLDSRHLTTNVLERTASIQDATGVGEEGARGDMKGAAGGGGL